MKIEKKAMNIKKKMSGGILNRNPAEAKITKEIRLKKGLKNQNTEVTLT